MTTVVVYKGVMAADSRRSWGSSGAYQDDVCKIKVVKRLFYKKQRVAAFAVSGDTSVNSHIVRDLTEPDRVGVDGDLETALLKYTNQLLKPSTALLVLLDDGTAISFYYYLKNGMYRWLSGISKPDDENSIAYIGSGGAYIRIIFDGLSEHYKLTAGDYAAIACMLDTHSGGEITTYSPSSVKVVRNHNLTKERLDLVLGYFKNKLTEGREHEEVINDQPDNISDTNTAPGKCDTLDADTARVI